jgi:MFS transporter, PPP family, 3-phenylpropionic acid transporter
MQPSRALDARRPASAMTSDRRIAARSAFFYGAVFASVGIHLPYWPVWLEAQGVSAAEIGILLAASYWPRIVTNLLLPIQADRMGERRRPMILLAAATFVAVVLFGLTDGFWMFLALSVITGASWAAILPLGEALVLHQTRERGIDYGRVRLWGSIAFILSAAGGGLWLERTGPALVLAMLLGTVALIIVACALLPETRVDGGRRKPPSLGRLMGVPRFLAFTAAAGLIQVSHATYYGFATLHWRAAGHGEALIGGLWAEGVIAEVVFFAVAGSVLRRMHALQLLALAGGLAALRWALTALGTDLVLLIPAQALHAASFGAAHLAAMHHLRDHVPPELQASAQGFYSAIGIALPFALLAPLAGWMYGALGGGAFWPMAALALAGAALAWRIVSGPIVRI